MSLPLIWCARQVTGGRNGYGAKLANIFSTEFIIETCDGTRQRRYRQVFRSNMSVKETPKITNCKASDNWTCVSFKPDLAKFGMEALDDDTLALMRRRVYDLAGILGKGVKVGEGEGALQPPAAELQTHPLSPVQGEVLPRILAE